MTNQPLSNKDMWDDAAVQNGWNEVLVEYKKYHSLARYKAEDIEKLLDEAEAEEERAIKEDDSEAVGQWVPVEGEPDDHTVDDNGINLQESVELSAAAEEVSQNEGEQSPSSVPTQDKATRKPNIDSNLLDSIPAHGGGQDESLKNLMMSWYYAGYYTGYHAGQLERQQKEAEKP
ncbi:MAG: hypothetical protein M1820_000379 [Bogoriella megaspora]|nr:MAG: hypothetical protein M1820_000379 [Bogoriella megaspora]